MNKVMLGLAAASLAAGGILLSYSSPNLLSSANAEAVDIQGVDIQGVDIQGNDTEQALLEGLSFQDAETSTAAAIAKTYVHKLAGREATTVYVRNIPVVTFLAESESGKLEATTSLPEESAGSNSVSTTVSETFVDTINQLSQEGIDAQKIGVKWDAAKEQYVIHVAETPLIAMSDRVMLPSTTKDEAEDALQITNRLRRQIGNVKPLKQIEGRPAAPKIAAAPTNARRYQQGWASWYGPGFHGNLTADGSRYNQYGLTAAHRTLPFGTRLRVTNQNNGRSVVVVVNDRGPFIHNRVIDLSMGAAQVLGVVNTGVAPVTIDIVN